MDASHLGDDLHLFLDGRLADDRMRAVEQHLAGCARCRRELDAMRMAKDATRELPELPVPSSLRVRVTEALDRADRQQSGPAVAPSPRIRRPALVGLGLAAAAVLVLLLLRFDRNDFVQAAARDFANVRSSALSLEFTTTDPATLEREFAGTPLPFAIRVFDFGMMGYALAGGRNHEVGGRESALFAYRNADGRYVVCQMFGGAVAELPAPAEEHENNGIRFLVYREGPMTLVFWQEGRVVCVLTSDGPPEEALQLAFAKAVRTDNG